MNNALKKVSMTLLIAFMALAMLALSPVGFRTVAHAEEEVHTIYWRAKNTKPIKLKIASTGDTINIKKNTKLMVTKRNYNWKKASAKSWVRYGEYRFKVPNKILKFTKDLCTGNAGDYADETKENWVNSSGLTSDTDQLIWVCLDKQRVNVFTREGGSWKLAQCFPTCTGKAATPTPAKKDRVNFKKQVYQIEGSRVQYFVEAVGSGFHMWPLKGSFKNRIGKHTISHGCIRLRKADAIWMFKNIKLKTTVQIF